LGVPVYGLGFGVYGLEFMVWEALWSMVWGLGFGEPQSHLEAQPSSPIRRVCKYGDRVGSHTRPLSSRGVAQSTLFLSLSLSLSISLYLPLTHTLTLTLILTRYVYLPHTHSHTQGPSRCEGSRRVEFGQPTIYRKDSQPVPKKTHNLCQKDSQPVLPSPHLPRDVLSLERQPQRGLLLFSFFITPKPRVE